jgi:hypothetical protein
MAFPTSETERMIPNNISDVGLKDEDSGLQLFRGMMSPWDQIKSFKETYNFLIRHAALISVGYMHSMRLIIPDYEKCQTLMSDSWAAMMDGAWDPEAGQVEAFEERFDVPPFLKDGVIRSALYADKGDEQMLMSGHIWYCSNDRVEKEIHTCQYDIAGPEVCDLSVGGGSHFCYGLACQKLNNYDPERIGCGDEYCVAIMESRKKYGDHANAEKSEFGPDGHEWEGWGPPAGGLREKGMPRKKECEFLSTGTFTSPTGATWTAGEMYKDCNMWPLAFSYTAIDVMRNELSSAETEAANRIIDVIFETSGKFQFGEWNTRKAARDWMGVPAAVDDGRVLGGYISMVWQARSLAWKFLEFTPEKTVIECERAKMIMMGMYPEFIPAYEAYFNGAAKTLVAAQWTVKAEDDEDNDKVRFIIQKGPYGYRRQKPNLNNYENQAKA